MQQIWRAIPLVLTAANALDDCNASCQESLNALMLVQRSHRAPNGNGKDKDKDEGDTSGPADSCRKQWDCSTWTVTTYVDVDETDTTKCSNGDCVFKACWKYSNAACVKKRDRLSHACDGAEEVKDVRLGYELCKVGGPLDTLEFVIKDGRHCTEDMADPPKFLHAEGCAKPGSVTCSKTTAEWETCTGKGNVGKECMWRVVLPDISSCSVWGDPHVSVFDGKQVSLSKQIGLAAGDEASTMQAYVAGDMWLVKGADVSIQVRYLPDDDLPTGRLFVGALAVGGRFLQGNTLIIRPLGEQVSWNGKEILTSEISEFKVQGLLRAKQHKNSSLVTNMTKSSPGIDLKLPVGVRLTVNRFERFINARVKMPALEGGQDGLCGNYNGDASDDALGELVRHRELKVDPQDSLF